MSSQEGRLLKENDPFGMNTWIAYLFIIIYIYYIVNHIDMYNDYPLCSSTTFNNKDHDFPPTSGTKELMLKAVGRHGQAFPGRLGCSRLGFCLANWVW